MAVHDALLAAANERAAADDDTALVGAALDDPTAFAPLYRRYRDRVYWYIRRAPAATTRPTFSRRSG